MPEFDIDKIKERVSNEVSNFDLEATKQHLSSKISEFDFENINKQMSRGKPRFDLAEQEKLLLVKRHVVWRNKNLFDGNYGTLYLTNKRVVFCATEGWKITLLVAWIWEFLIKSRHIRWEAPYSNLGHVKGSGLLESKMNFLTLEGNKTGIVIEDDVINLINDTKKRPNLLGKFLSN